MKRLFGLVNSLPLRKQGQCTTEGWAKNAEPLAMLFGLGNLLSADG